MTERAKRFIDANRQSPVVYGSVLTDPKKRNDDGIPVALGCYYRLADGRKFTLNVEECRAITPPRWAHEETFA